MQGGVKGFDGGKLVKGRKRHIWVDSLGLLLAVLVTAANAQDGRAACQWAAVRHGLSVHGNDHIHIVASHVRENADRVDNFRQCATLASTSD